MSLPPGHHKVSIDVVQSHKEDSPLPVPIEDENLMTLRDAIGSTTFIKRKGKKHFQTNESVTSPMKGSVHHIIPEEFAGAAGVQGRDWDERDHKGYPSSVVEWLLSLFLYKLKEEKTVNAHIVQALQRYANQYHLVLVPYIVG
ncbi:hypothetical protein SESBI_27075 [Sesbania bispinosa]|nr:hypothetical protein SESBI_27075 [Sesbania bispinosa]